LRKSVSLIIREWYIVTGSYVAMQYGPQCEGTARRKLEATRWSEYSSK
jgi:hypothetical protein